MNPTKTKQNLAARASLVIVILLQSMGLSSSAEQSFTYDPAGRLVAADYGAGKSASYAYDNAGNLIQSSQPSPAILVSSLVGNQLTLAWPVSPAGFILQTAPDLNPATTWSNVNLTPAQVGNFYTVTLTVTTGGFYRLKKP